MPAEMACIGYGVRPPTARSVRGRGAAWACPAPHPREATRPGSRLCRGTTASSVCMTPAWVTITVAAVGGLAAIGATLVSFLYNARLNREARKQQRLAEAYVELLTFANKVGYWAALVQPALQTNPPQELPPLPLPAEQARVEALVAAYASEDMQEAVTSWRAVVIAVRQVAILINFARDPASGIDSAKQWARLDLELRPAELAARDALGEQVAAELGHRRAR